MFKYLDAVTVPAITNFLDSDKDNSVYIALKEFKNCQHTKTTYIHTSKRAAADVDKIIKELVKENSFYNFELYKNELLKAKMYVSGNAIKGAE